jgi:DNA-binding NarL/FixJ family response regulator
VGASWTLAKLIDAAFEELGRKEVTDRASARTSVNGPAFTARELDVMRLLAQGLSDRDIAAELRVSPRTASTHVTNILHKLGESSRSAAAAYAVRHNLAS